MNNLLAVVFGARCKGKFSDLIRKSPFVLLTTIISVLIVIDRLIVHILRVTTTSQYIGRPIINTNTNVTLYLVITTYSYVMSGNVLAISYDV